MSVSACTTEKVSSDVEIGFDREPGSVRLSKADASGADDGGVGPFSWRSSGTFINPTCRLLVMSVMFPSSSGTLRRLSTLGMTVDVACGVRTGLLYAHTKMLGQILPLGWKEFFFSGSLYGLTLK